MFQPPPAAASVFPDLDFVADLYVMDHDKKKAPELRQVIAATVISNPTKYSEAFLGKPNGDYCSWIIDSEKWGGAIELSILADQYIRELQPMISRPHAVTCMASSSSSSKPLLLSLGLKEHSMETLKGIVAAVIENRSW